MKNKGKDKGKNTEKELKDMLTPAQIVKELDKYIIGQKEAKKAVAIALRNRARRKLLDKEMREEIAPKNILMIGPTGVGKTEIARRLANLANAPFIKVEATKYTEIGYVGRDVESMIRDLTTNAVNTVKKEHKEIVYEKAEKLAEETILDILVEQWGIKKEKKDEKEEEEKKALPNLDVITKEILDKGLKILKGIGDLSDDKAKDINKALKELGLDVAIDKLGKEEKKMDEKTQNKKEEEELPYEAIRESIRNQLRRGELDDHEIEIDVYVNSMPAVEIFSNIGMDEMGFDFSAMLGGMFPQKRKKRKVTVKEAKMILREQEADKLIDMDKVIEIAINRVEETGIIFIDEVDKIAGREKGSGPDVSREGVQRDILPIIEGSTINTRYGPVKTDHILFIAAGAFHVSKPSDLIPELQGRFPIRVELESLGKDTLKRILVEPKNALIKQYKALLSTEGIELDFTDDSIEAIAKLAYDVNMKAENIGARRLHTIMEKLIEDISFNAPTMRNKKVVIDAKYVNNKLKDIVKDNDLSRYIL